MGSDLAMSRPVAEVDHRGVLTWPRADEQPWVKGRFLLLQEFFQQGRGKLAGGRTGSDTGDPLLGG